MTALRALALVGPTGTGKSEFASRLAAECGGEVVNADSRQIYRGMRIGTAWPSDEQFARAPHHLYGIASPAETYNAGRYVRDASAAIAAIAARGKFAIVTGGTGLYVEALAGSMPLDRPIASDTLRARMRAEAAAHPADALRAWLTALAPQAAARIPSGDRYRTLRALEAALAIREGAAEREEVRPHVALSCVVLEADRVVLRERIAARTRSMFDAGLVEEAQDLERTFGDVAALTGIGYAEALAYARGLMRREEAIGGVIRRTAAYAKRQQTWFRRIAGAMRLDALEPATWSSLRALARELAPAN
jgi:tRNA dimethylallyltransferase